MKVVLGQALLAQPPAPGAESARLAGALVEQELYYDDTDGLLIDSPLYMRLCSEQAWLRPQLDQARPYSAASRRPRVVIGGALGRAASVESATAPAFLNASLVILVEDVENDGNFVFEALRRKWRGDQLSLEELLQSIEKQHGGGGRIGEVIAELHRSQRRVVVVVDSDRDHDDERARGILRGATACAAQDAVQRAASPLIELFVLDRREAENYISEEEVLDWTSRIPKPADLLAAWKSGGRWRWYFDMKKGRKAGSVVVPPQIEAQLGSHNFGKHVHAALVTTSKPGERKLLDHDETPDIDRLIVLIQELR